MRLTFLKYNISVRLAVNLQYIYVIYYVLIVYLESDNETGYSFRGFMIQARAVADDSPVGYFISNGTEYEDYYQPQCDNNVSTHT